MSVINKMLRDLDARRTDGALSERARAAPAGTMQGTFSVQAPAERALARRLRWLLLVLVLAAGATAAWFGGLMDGPASMPVAAPPSVVAASPAVPTVPALPEPAASAPATAASMPMTPDPASLLVAPPPVASKPVRRPEAAAADLETRPGARADKKETPDMTRAKRADSAPTAPATVPKRPAQTAAVVVPAAPPGAQPPRRPTAALETLAQAQALWNAGSRESALDLLRQAVSAVERAEPVDIPLLAQLVREQVRMELALGRPDAALNLLTRLEPALAGQADLWAVRGNTAQRLGRHQESVQAYLQALQLRPGEPRWMLGAAVSLAALGQLEAAAQQAEQARVLGPVSPEVLGYLRQAGVKLR